MNYKGLTTKEVEISRKKYGTNSLTKVKGNTFFKLFQYLYNQKVNLLLQKIFKIC